jgi:hypothetical protein
MWNCHFYVIYIYIYIYHNKHHMYIVMNETTNVFLTHVS